MGYKQSPGRKNMPKTGRGVDTAALMTGTPAKQMSQAYYDSKGRNIKRDEKGEGEITENSSYMNQLRGSVPAAKGQLYTDSKTGKTKFPNGNSASDILDFDDDGDTVFNDSNDDGTMLSRGIKAAYKAATK